MVENDPRSHERHLRASKAAGRPISNSGKRPLGRAMASEGLESGLEAYPRWWKTTPGATNGT